MNFQTFVQNCQTNNLNVREELEKCAEACGVPLEIRTDRHFFDTVEGFREWAGGRKTLVLETFYRHMRKKHGILLAKNGKPEGGEWNFDKENRESFGKDGPPAGMKAPRRFAPDAVTKEVIELVEKRFADHPGSLEEFESS